MKIAIHDSKNTARHLGDIEYTGSIANGRIIRISTMGLRGFPLYSSAATAYDMRHVEFKVSVLTSSNRKAISPTVTELTTIERLVFVTDMALPDLMKLPKFTLPSETDHEASYRRHCAGKSEPSRRPMTATEYAMRYGY